MNRLIGLLSTLAICAGLIAIGRLATAPRGPRSELRFDGFPLDRPRTVEFGSVPDGLQASWKEAGGAERAVRTSRREIADQYRDWVLVTIASAANAPVTDLSRALYDRPPVRNDYLRRVGWLEAGPTRSLALENGQVIALVPVAGAAARVEDLARIADEQRKNLGQAPAAVHVFEYTMHAGEQFATVTRRTSIKGADLFQEPFGYLERTVSTLAGFRAFMASIDDVTFARMSGSSLVLGGRKLRRPYRGIRTEDVAAIWKSEDDGSAARRGSGFSLDPQIDLAHLREFHNKLETSAGARRVFGADAIENARLVLANNEPGRYFDALEQGCREQRVYPDCKGLIRNGVIWPNLLQAARYDGRLQGTEVGMVLFYTDLLMKMWSLDYAGCTPRTVDGFPVKTLILIPALYRRETEQLSETRLWLGPLERGYQIAQGGETALFARNATRVFAVPHDFRENKDNEKEVEPNYYNRIFITWWNDHFEEVARYEPEYERLNEIMKWSELIGWLNGRSKGELLGFLRAVPDAPPVWFPDWVKRHPELTFQAWDRVPFHSRGYASLKTESLAMLRSPENRPIPLTGGVSLARREAVQARAVLSEDLAASARRAGIDSGELTATGGKLRMIDKSEFAFQAERNMARVTAQADTQMRFRGEFSELRNMALNDVLERSPGSFRLRTAAGRQDVGVLDVSRTAKGFRVAWQSRDVDLGQSLARRISATPDPVSVLRSDPNVQAVVVLDDSRGVLVQTHGSKRWIHFAAGNNENTTLAPGFQARVSAPAADARTIDVAWLDDADVQGQLKSDRYVYIREPGPGGEAPVLEFSARGPPDGTITEWKDARGAAVKVYGNRGSGRAVRWDELPADLRSDPVRLASLSDGKVPPLGPAPAKFADEMRNGNYVQAMRRLAADPGQYRAAASEYLDYELRMYNELLQHQQFSLALRQMNDAITIYGRSPDLVFRRALAEIGQGRPERAAATIGDVAPVRMRDADAFFNEIDDRLAQAGISSQERDNLTELARLADWQQQRLARANPDIQMRLVVDNNQAHLAVAVDELPRAQPGELRAVLQGDGPVYVQDVPGLNNLDWNASFTTTLEQLISARQVTVRELELVDIAEFRPAVVYETRTHITYRLANTTRQPVRFNARVYNPNSQDDDKKRKRRFYLIVSNSASQA